MNAVVHGTFVVSEYSVPSPILDITYLVSLIYDKMTILGPPRTERDVSVPSLSLRVLVSVLYSTFVASPIDL